MSISIDGAGRPDPERTWRAFAAGVAAAILATPAGAGAQELGEFAAACGAGGGADLEARCTLGALALQSSRSGIGLAAAGGSPLPGTGSTLGLRLGTIPRLSFALRGSGTVHWRPRIIGRATGEPPRDDEAVFVPGIHGRVALGVVDGFSLAPTVGGFLSVDLVGSVDHLSLPEGEGFDGSVTAWGLGARLGVLRESFTLPGVSVSGVYRSMDDVNLGSAMASGSDDVGMEFDVKVTSLRATVSKDFLVVGLLAGAGWDRYSGDARLRIRSADAGGGEGTATSDALADDRILFYGGMSLTFLVLQISAEGGWATGHDAFRESPPTDFDPGGGSPFASLAARITF